MNPIGLYLHLPFCVKKCGYCDFYSVCDLSVADSYTDLLCRQIDSLDVAADSVYLGGGTPSLLGAERLERILKCARRIMTADCEVTVEVNPGDALQELLPRVVNSGVNRLSIGMQSHNDAVLKRLTRRHNAADVEKAVLLAQQSGVKNYSLDVMLGVEGLTTPVLEDTLAFCRDSGATHISAYMLKIEEDTPFARVRDSLDLPDEDETVDQYLYTCNSLGHFGFEQYEISNFAKRGNRSRHNMKYWTLDEYIGLGPAAHSYYKGKRFCYPRDIEYYLGGGSPVEDELGGGFDEYVMLRLRLSDGLNLRDALRRYPQEEKRIEHIQSAAHPFADGGLLRLKDEAIALTPRGFLVSNSIISEFLM